MLQQRPDISGYQATETIVASLARETGQSPGIIERDVRDFVASLEAWKISPR